MLTCASSDALQQQVLLCKLALQTCSKRYTTNEWCIDNIWQVNGKSPHASHSFDLPHHWLSVQIHNEIHCSPIKHCIEYLCLFCILFSGRVLQKEVEKVFAFFTQLNKSLLLELNNNLLKWSWLFWALKMFFFVNFENWIWSVSVTHPMLHLQIAFL